MKDLVLHYERAIKDKVNNEKSLDNFICKDKKVCEVAKKWFEQHRDFVENHPHFKLLEDRIDLWSTHNSSSYLTQLGTNILYYSSGLKSPQLSLNKDSDSEFIRFFSEENVNKSFSEVVQHILESPKLLDLLPVLKELNILSDSDLEKLGEALTTTKLHKDFPTIQRKISQNEQLSKLLPSVKDVELFKNVVRAGNQAEISLSKTPINKIKEYLNSITDDKRLFEELIKIRKDGNSLMHNEEIFKEYFIKAMTYIVKKPEVNSGHTHTALMNEMRIIGRPKYIEFCTTRNHEGVSLLDVWNGIKAKKDTRNNTLVSKYGDMRRELGLEYDFSVDNRIKEINQAALPQPVRSRDERLSMGVEQKIHLLENKLSQLEKFPNSDSEIYALGEVKELLDEIKATSSESEAKLWEGKLKKAINQAFLNRFLESDGSLYLPGEREERVLKIRIGSVNDDSIKAYKEYVSDRNKILSDMKEYKWSESDLNVPLDIFKEKCAALAFYFRLNKIASKDKLGERDPNYAKEFSDPECQRLVRELYEIASK